MCKISVFTGIVWYSVPIRVEINEVVFFSPQRPNTFSGHHSLRRRRCRWTPGVPARAQTRLQRGCVNPSPAACFQGSVTPRGCVLEG